MMATLLAAAFAALGAPGAVPAADAAPRYDVPRGFDQCPDVRAWNGFFKWASVDDTTCRRARAFVSAYARAAAGAESMPRAVRGYRCAIRYWRTDEGDVYASRHRCTRDGAVIRFYGMV